MNREKLCEQFVKDVCAILHIDAPRVEFVPAESMRTDSQLAASIPGKILVVNDVKVSPELFLALAHELRHVYQIANGANLEEYQTSDKMTVDEYNLQPLEVDANAFAFLIMEFMFGISPQFESLDQSARDAITSRAEQILSEFVGKKAP